MVNSLSTIVFGEIETTVSHFKLCNFFLCFLSVSILNSLPAMLSSSLSRSLFPSSPLLVCLLHSPLLKFLHFGTSSYSCFIIIRPPSLYHPLSEYSSFILFTPSSIPLPLPLALCRPPLTLSFNPFLPSHLTQSDRCVQYKPLFRP